MDTSTRSYVDYLISISHDILVMFDNNDSISEIHEFSQIIEEEPTVPRMETDRGLIEDIGDSLKSRTHLGRKSYSLRLTS